MARNFSASLNSAFAIDDSTTITPQLNNLAQSVSEKKAAVDSQTSELQALEARIREMDQRLEQKRSRASSPAGTGGVIGGRGAGSGGSEPRRSPLGDTFQGGSVNAPGAAGNYYGASGTRSEAGSEAQLGDTSGPLAGRITNLPARGQQGLPERRVPVPSSRENLSASTKSQWMPSDDRGAVADVRE